MIVKSWRFPRSTRLTGFLPSFKTGKIYITRDRDKAYRKVGPDGPQFPLNWNELVFVWKCFWDCIPLFNSNTFCFCFLLGFYGIFLISIIRIVKTYRVYESMCRAGGMRVFGGYEQFRKICNNVLWPSFRSR